MRTVGALIAATAAIAFRAECSTMAQDTSPALDLRARVERALGATPADCGQFFVTRFGRPAASATDLRGAVACMAEHAANGRAAWILVQLSGIDSWVAEGLLVGRDGRVRYYDYDNDPSGGGHSKPRFTEKPCSSPGVDDGDKADTGITCGAPRVGGIDPASRAFNGVRRPGRP